MDKVNLYQLETALTSVLATFPNHDKKLVAYIDGCTINRNSFDFYSRNYWDTPISPSASISAIVTDVYNKFLKFSDLLKNSLQEKIESTLNPKLKLQVGSLFKYTDDKTEKQNFVVLGMHRVQDSIIVYYMPENTPVRNHSMFHYGLYTKYKVTRY